MRVFKSHKISEFEEYVRLQSDIVQVIGEYVDLHKKGQHYVGRCPFHSDGVNKELAVYPDRRIFMCWSAGCYSGNVFDFIEKINSVDRRKAIEILASKIGISASLFDQIPRKTYADDIRVSYSMLKLFQQCPLRYKHKYIDGEVDERTISYLALGRIIHQTLADFFRKNVEDRSLQTLLSVLENRWKSVGFKSREEEKEYRNRANDMLIDYFHSHDCNANAWKIESSIECKRKDMTITGTVDRIDILPDGSCEIIDYKTEPVDSHEENKMQLAFYYYGVLETYKIPISKLTLEYLQARRAIPVSLSETELEQQIERAYNIMTEIGRTTNFTSKANPYCADCTLVSSCQKSRNSH
jgi:CRISPR/Cas system-associated exonuclease Cas4 (RecB family)